MHDHDVDRRPYVELPSVPPRVSVIVPAYNAEEFIAEALDSVLAQDYSNLELIVSDDGSTDGTTEIVEVYAERHADKVVHVRADRNAGVGAARNRGLRAMTGELIAWLDADDVMLPGKIERQVNALLARPTAAGVVHDAEVFDSKSGRVLGRFSEVTNGYPLREGGAELWLDPTYKMLPSATMIRASARPDWGIDERLDCSDWLFDLETFQHGPCIVVDEVLVRYRRHGGNLTSSIQSTGADFEQMLMSLALVEARYPRLSGPTKSFRSALMLGEARRRLQHRDWAQAIAYAWASARGGGPSGLGGVAGHLARSAYRRRKGRWRV